MAAYEYLVGESTLQVLGEDVVRDAQRVTARAVQSGIVFSLLFAPIEIWNAASIGQQLDYWAGVWDQNAQVPGVAGITVGQTVDAAGHLVDQALVIVSSTSGKSTIQITLPPFEWLPDKFPYWVNLWRGNLDTQEAGGVESPTSVVSG